MISYQQIGTKGRLGNSLFQIASCIGISKTLGTEIVFNESPIFNYFKGDFKTGTPSLPKLTEEFFHYSTWAKDNMELDGWLQSQKYWRDSKEFVRSMLTFKEDIADNLQTFNTSNAICISVRRGDFVGNPNYYQLGIEYYLFALIEHFPDFKTRNVIILSDDIPYCKIHFSALPNVQFAERLDPMEQLYLGSMCSDFIISNSTFSWWVAYLANKGKVIRPIKNFDGKLAQNSEKDYWIESWTPFNYEGKRFDLTNVTFTIPIFYDHKDRKNNIDLSVHLIQRCCNTNFIVGEQGSNKFEYFKEWGQYIKFDLPYFHRTKMLNDMANMATTPYVVNWDCDNVLPPLQLYMMGEYLKESDVVYPFDGRVARLDRKEWFPKLNSGFDIGIVTENALKGKGGREMPFNSTGHAVAFNKEKFFEGGGENEKFITWGPEDSERYHRFEKLGFKISRVKGIVFHIDHFIGPNSSKLNPHYKNNFKEYDKIISMNKEELKKYVEKWSWLSHIKK